MRERSLQFAPRCRRWLRPPAAPLRATPTFR